MLVIVGYSIKKELPGAQYDLCGRYSLGKKNECHIP